MRQTRILLLLSSLMVLTVNHAAAQQAAPQTSSTHKFRTILTVVGAAGGFTAGFLIGRAAYDTPDSDGKVWAASTITAAAGGAGGYLIGWAVDHRRNRNRIALGSDKFDLTPLVSKDTKGLQVSWRLGPAPRSRLASD